MKNLSDEELVSYRDDMMEFIDTGNEKDLALFNKVSQELISRLERGRKAIEFANALIKHRNDGVDLESGGRIYNWLDQYEGQSCKEATK